jgi:hypothetical protein
MAFATIFHVPTRAVTETARLHADPPEGLVTHLAGLAEDGLRIVSVWESAAHHDRFVAERLHPALRRHGLGADPGRSTPSSRSTTSWPHRHRPPPYGERVAWQCSPSHAPFCTARYHRTCVRVWPTSRGPGTTREEAYPVEATVPRRERLELARGLLRRAEERAERVRQAPETGHGLLPVAEPLTALLPGRGLRPGGTAAITTAPGATSLLLALLAEASGSGAWIGVVGRPDLGIVAAAEAGLRLERLALVPHPGADLVAVTTALLDGLDVVAVAGAAAVRAADRQRLAARARQRGAVLVALGGWPGADVALTCTDIRWAGLGAGVGRLRTRRLRVQARGRGLGPAGREVELLLPGPGGRAASPGPAHGASPLVEVGA